MQLTRLQVANLRNLGSVFLGELDRLTLIVGPNGSGKTSLLEAIYLLCSGRSFRHHQLRPLLREGFSSCVVFGGLLDTRGVSHTMGVQKSFGGETLAKWDGERVSSLADMVRLVPVLTLHGESFELLSGPPALRREYLDWLLFHVEHDFLRAWREAQRALRQRNSLIRRDKIDRSQLDLWSRAYAQCGERVDAFRRDAVARLVPEVRSALNVLLPDGLADQLSIVYQGGWKRELPLEELLLNDWQRDADLGYTRAGPHRADLRILFQQRSAAELLSRGQQKLVVAALRFAQVRLLNATGRSTLLLVDDLPAELDRVSRTRLCHLLEHMGQQTFVTATSSDDLTGCWLKPDTVKMFHVEHGAINAALPPLHND